MDKFEISEQKLVLMCSVNYKTSNMNFYEAHGHVSSILIIVGKLMCSVKITVST
jgi:hypothetical protein